MPQFPFSLRFSIPAILLILGAGLVSINIQQETAQSFHRVEEDVRSTARFTAEQMASMLEYLYRRSDEEQAEIAIGKLQRDPNLRVGLVYDHRNTVMLATQYELRSRELAETPAAPNANTFPWIRETMAGQVHLSQDGQSIWAAYPILLKMLPGELRPSRVGILWLKYDVSTLKQRALTDAVRRSLPISLGLGFFCLAVWGFFSHTLTRRAAQLVTVSHRFAQGEMTQRAQIHGSDELAEIAEAFNQMADRIQADTEILQNRQVALTQINETLEHRVQERTASLHQQKEQLELTLRELQSTQAQLVQNEKMSSLGRLVAGVAHEINNPISFIQGNFSYLKDYSYHLLHLMQLYQEHYPHPVPEIATEIADCDFVFLEQDLPRLLSSMESGTQRICDIVLSLRNFSRMDEAEFKRVDIHPGIDNALMILQHRLLPPPPQPPIAVAKTYAQLPGVECFPGQLNQALMNILVNALDALECRNAKHSAAQLKADPSQLTISTAVIDAHWIEIAIADNGAGIPTAIQSQIFDPFFTTKPIGTGTGMGLAISYQVITEKHHGKILCRSQPGAGTAFIIKLPIRQSVRLLPAEAVDNAEPYFAQSA
jgi:signal transduction histidine kinase